MSLPKPECPRHHGSDKVKKCGDKWYCSKCNIYFRDGGTGGAERYSFAFRPNPHTKYHHVKVKPFKYGRKRDGSNRNKLFTGGVINNIVDEEVAIYKVKKTIVSKKSHKDSIVAIRKVRNIIKNRYR